MRRTLIAGGLALLLLGTACGENRRSDPPAAAGSPTASRQDPGQVERTLASLRKIDDLPMYEMTYDGDYDPTAGLALRSRP